MFSVLRAPIPPPDRTTMRLPETDDRHGLASPRRTSTAPETKHATAVPLRVGPYIDPNHKMYPEGSSWSYFIQIPQPPESIQTKPNSRQSHCSTATIVGFVGVGAFLFLSDLPGRRAWFSLGFPAMSVRASTGDRN